VNDFTDPSLVLDQNPFIAQAGSHPGRQNLLLESGKIINSLKLNFGVLESRHSLLQYWMHRE